MIWLRSLLFNLYCVCVTGLLFVPATYARFFAPETMGTYAQLLGKWVLSGLRVICGLGFAVEGSENLPRDGAPALIASRHESAFDTLVWLNLVPSCSYVIKQELADLPLLGPLFVIGGMIPVDRAAGGAGLRRLSAAVGVALASRRQVIIFPEGTRVAADAPVNLQPGLLLLAAQSGFPIIPVATNAGQFWGRRSFLKRPGIIRLVIGPPIPVTGDRRAMLGTLTRALHMPPSA